MAKRKTELGLGRGLNALLGDPELSAPGEGSVSLPISQVEPGLNQPRKRFDPESLSDLADSIRIHGVIQPVTVRRLASGYYQIIAGERRWRAAKQAGLDEIPAVIIEADDRKVMEMGLIENLQREDLNPAEEARGYQTLMEEYGLTQEQVAERMGKSRPAVTNTLRLLALPEDLLSWWRRAPSPPATPGPFWAPPPRPSSGRRPSTWWSADCPSGRRRPWSRPFRSSRSSPRRRAGTRSPSIWGSWRSPCPADWAGR